MYIGRLFFILLALVFINGCAMEKDKDAQYRINRAENKRKNEEVSGIYEGKFVNESEKIDQVIRMNLNTVRLVTKTATNDNEVLVSLAGSVQLGEGTTPFNFSDAYFDETTGEIYVSYLDRNSNNTLSFKATVTGNKLEGELQSTTTGWLGKFTAEKTNKKVFFENTIAVGDLTGSYVGEINLQADASTVSTKSSGEVISPQNAIRKDAISLFLSRKTVVENDTILQNQFRQFDVYDGSMIIGKLDSNSYTKFSFDQIKYYLYTKTFVAEWQKITADGNLKKVSLTGKLQDGKIILGKLASNIENLAGDFSLQNDFNAQFPASNSNGSATTPTNSATSSSTSTATSTSTSRTSNSGDASLDLSENRRTPGGSSGAETNSISSDLVNINGLYEGTLKISGRNIRYALNLQKVNLSSSSFEDRLNTKANYRGNLLMAEVYTKPIQFDNAEYDLKTNILIINYKNGLELITISLNFRQGLLGTVVSAGNSSKLIAEPNFGTFEYLQLGLVGTFNRIQKVPRFSMEQVQLPCDFLGKIAINVSSVMHEEEVEINFLPQDGRNTNTGRNDLSILLAFTGSMLILDQNKASRILISEGMFNKLSREISFKGLLNNQAIEFFGKLEIGSDKEKTNSSLILQGEMRGSGVDMGILTATPKNTQEMSKRVLAPDSFAGYYEGFFTVADNRNKKIPWLLTLKKANNSGTDWQDRLNILQSMNGTLQMGEYFTKPIIFQNAEFNNRTGRLTIFFQSSSEQIFVELDLNGSQTQELGSYGKIEIQQAALLGTITQLKKVDYFTSINDLLSDNYQVDLAEVSAKLLNKIVFQIDRLSGRNDSTGFSESLVFEALTGSITLIAEEQSTKIKITRGVYNKLNQEVLLFAIAPDGNNLEFVGRLENGSLVGSLRMNDLKVASLKAISSVENKAEIISRIRRIQQSFVSKADSKVKLFLQISAADESNVDLAQYLHDKMPLKVQLVIAGDFDFQAAGLDGLYDVASNTFIVRVGSVPTRLGTFSLRLKLNEQNQLQGPLRSESSDLAQIITLEKANLNNLSKPVNGYYQGTFTNTQKLSRKMFLSVLEEIAITGNSQNQLSIVKRFQGYLFVQDQDSIPIPIIMDYNGLSQNLEFSFRSNDEQSLKFKGQVTKSPEGILQIAGQFFNNIENAFAQVSLGAVSPESFGLKRFPLKEGTYCGESVIMNGENPSTQKIPVQLDLRKEDFVNGDLNQSTKFVDHFKGAISFVSAENYGVNGTMAFRNGQYNNISRKLKFDYDFASGNSLFFQCLADENSETPQIVCDVLSNLTGLRSRYTFTYTPHRLSCLPAPKPGPIPVPLPAPAPQN